MLGRVIVVGWKEMKMYYHDLFNSIHLNLCFFFSVSNPAKRVSSLVIANYNLFDKAL